MSHELICSWLGLPDDAWPPDHYRLLGLEPGETDVAVIEQRVHQRLDRVRPYQMMHPEPATEAMKRIAEAWVCLTDPVQKKAYDQGLPGVRPRALPPPPPPRTPVPPTVAPAVPRLAGPAVPPPPLPASVLAAEAVPAPTAAPPIPPPPQTPRPQPRDPLVWLYTPGVNGPGEAPPPPPVRLPSMIDTAVPVEPAPAEAIPPPPPPEPTAPPPDPIVEAARSSRQAQRGLYTRRLLYQRIARTRQLLRLWHRLGKHLSDPFKRLGKQEAGDLAKLVEQVADVVEGFPLLGQAGQPGYLIVSLSQLDRKRDLQNLGVSQRESLQRDWTGGLRFLEAHRDFLRGEVQKERRRGRRGQFFRVAWASLKEEPFVAALVVLGLVALGVAVFVRSWL